VSDAGDDRPGGIDAIHAEDVLDLTRPVIARFDGGPLDGKEHVFFRARPVHWHRLSRGPLRRVLRAPPRYALYAVGAVWWEEGVQRGSYRFIGYDPDDLPGARPLFSHRAG
jgi:hypothetical protein